MKHKHKVVIYVVIIIVFIVCIIGANKIIKMKNEEDNAKPVTDENITQLRYTVSKDYVENTLVLKGTAVNHNINEVVVIEAEAADNTKVLINCNVYEDVNEGDIIFTIGSKEFKSSVSGKVREIINEEGSVMVSILNYGDILIDADVNYVFLDRMKVDDVVSVKEINPISEKQVFDEKIVGFGFEVNENLIPVYITNSKKFMPGTEFEIEYKYKNEVETCYILKEMLLKDIEGYYVFVEENGERVKREVVLGTEFVSWSGESKVQFVEVISGVEEGERLVVDIIE